LLYIKADVLFAHYQNSEEGEWAVGRYPITKCWGFNLAHPLFSPDLGLSFSTDCIY
jgi:hypothetical protein